MVQFFLVIFLFFLFVSRSTFVFWLALLAGFFLELFSASTFGLLMVSFILGLIGTHFLFSHFFTNRSLPALLVLGFCGTLLFHLIFLVLNLIIMIKADTNFSYTLSEYFAVIMKESLVNAILLSIFFVIANRFSRRLKTIFLVR
ncbi:MAG: hypothetical protein AAB849_01525 [Patescibacteria group bacterium]